MATAVINLSNLNGSNGFRLDGVAGGSYDGDYSGGSVSNAGDINGDGFDDLIVSAHSADPNGAESGSGYVVFGKASGFDAKMSLASLDGNNGFRLDGATAGDRLGNSVSGGGDVNGDGFDDLIVGAPYAGKNGIISGSSYMIFGKASGFDATLDLSSLNGSNGFRLDGEAEFDSLGSSVSSAGDVNNDGFDDLIVGADEADPNGYSSGSSYVVFGKSSDFSATWDLSSLDGSNGFRLDGESELDKSGSSVSNAGDVNGDGFDDLIVGAWGAGNWSAGSSYVLFGKDSDFDALLDPSKLDGANGFRLDGEVASYSGVSVSTAGDVNGDGFDDLIIGAPSSPFNPDNPGYSYVVFGKSSGFDALLDLSDLNGSNGFRLGKVIGGTSGGSVSGAGDVNGDGFDDLIVGAWSADPNGINDAGSSYVVFGKASSFEASLDLSSLDDNNGFRLDGEAEFDSLGVSVSSAGDVNSDGFDDLIVGAVGADPNGISNAGSSYVVFGRSDFTDSNVIEGTPGNDILKGTPGRDIFEAGDGNDTLIGRGGADEFHGDAGNDHIKVADLSFGSVNGGTGSDVLHTDGKDLNLDLGFLGDKIQGIETICLYGRGDNTLTLTAENLINLSDTSNTLKVHGNTGDRVILDDKWVDRGSHGFYHTYTQDDAVLLVGQNMAAEFA